MKTPNTCVCNVERFQVLYLRKTRNKFSHIFLKHPKTNIWYTSIIQKIKNKNKNKNKKHVDDLPWGQKKSEALPKGGRLLKEKGARWSELPKEA